MSLTTSCSQLLKTTRLLSPVLSPLVQHRRQLQYLLLLWMTMYWRMWSSSQWRWWPLEGRRGWMLEMQHVSTYPMMTVRFQMHQMFYAVFLVTLRAFLPPFLFSCVPMSPFVCLFVHLNVRELKQQHVNHSQSQPGISKSHKKWP